MTLLFTSGRSIPKFFFSEQNHCWRQEMPTCSLFLLNSALLFSHHYFISPNPIFVVGGKTKKWRIAKSSKRSFWILSVLAEVPNIEYKYSLYTYLQLSDLCTAKQNLSKNNSFYHQRYCWFDLTFKMFCKIRI